MIEIGASSRFSNMTSRWCLMIWTACCRGDFTAYSGTSSKEHLILFDTAALLALRGSPAFAVNQSRYPLGLLKRSEYVPSGFLWVSLIAVLSSQNARSGVQGSTSMWNLSY